jgi:predicted nucleic acid-binding protein
MNVVIDTNVVVSALISNSATRELMRDMNDTLVAPTRLEDEIDAHRDLIGDKSGLDESAVDESFARPFEHVVIVPDADLEPHREPAFDALGTIDQDDVIFLASALAVDGAIWSDDSGFRKQDLVPVVTTSDLIERRRSRVTPLSSSCRLPYAMLSYRPVLDAAPNFRFTRNPGPTMRTLLTHSTRRSDDRSIP